MSLHTLANHLQTAGRGEDKMLVHMTPSEVNGLQSLAMAHGGSLSINPETGLPEAGFLSGILPMIAGAALAATGVGAPMAALMVGGAGAVATGSLQKGLMMGLGAYGGAGLGAGLLGGAAAAPAVAAGAGTAVPAAVGAGQALTSTGLAGSPATFSSAAGAATGAGAAANQLPIGLQSATGVYAPPGSALPNPVATMNQGQAAYADYMAKNPIVASNAVSPTVTGAQSVDSATMFDKLKSMPGKAYDLLSGSGPEAEKAREDFLKKNKNYLMAGGLGTLMMSRDEQKAPKESTNYQPINPAYYSYMQDRPGAAFADGGSVGQPVERMSQDNSVGANTNYPMANIKPYGYSVPRNNPISQNVFQPDGYQNLDPYTGEQKFAKGGSTKPSTPSGGLGSIFGQKPSASAKPSGIPAKPSGLGSIVTAAKAPAAKAAPAASTSKPVTPAPKQATATPVNKPVERNASQYGSTIKPRVDTRAAVPEKEGTYTPNLVVDSKGRFVPTKDLPPVTEFKKFGTRQEAAAYLYDSKVKKIVEPEDVKDMFNDALRREPTEAEMDAVVGKPMTINEIVKFAQSRPDFRAKTTFTDDDIKDNFKYYIGKEPTAGELKSIKNGNPTSFDKLQWAIINRPSYLDNINKIAEGKFTEQQKTETETQAEAEKQATSMKVDDVFSTFSNVLGRSPNKDELNQYIGAKETLDSLTSKLKTSDEYLNKLAQGSKGVSYTADTGKTATSFTPATTGITGANTGVIGATGAAGTSGAAGATTGAATGLSGLQEPTGRGTINVPGAFPVAPDWFNSQLGIQNLASLAAQKAAPLQGGLDFALPTTTANPFGFDPTLATPEQLQAEMLRRAQLSGSGATGNTTGTTVTGALGMATGGMTGYNLGGYSDGGRLLKGPGDGVSDSIPATIGNRQPARLADGEFVVPARIVSELGNGSTDAGARKLYVMMERIQRARNKTVGRNKVAVRSGADKMLPA